MGDVYRPKAVRSQAVTAKHRVMVQRGDGSKVFSPSMVLEAAPAGSPRKRLEASLSVPHGTREPRPVTSIATVFDDVWVKASAVRAALRQGIFFCEAHC
jgi:hypothetical protein